MCFWFVGMVSFAFMLFFFGLFFFDLGVLYLHLLSCWLRCGISFYVWPFVSSFCVFGEFFLLLVPCALLFSENFRCSRLLYLSRFAPSLSLFRVLPAFLSFCFVSTIAFAVSISRLFPLARHTGSAGRWVLLAWFVGQPMGE